MQVKNNVTNAPHPDTGNRFYFTDAFRLLCRISPEIKRSLWRMWYQYLAANDGDADLLFMNYGFANLNANAKKLSLTDSDEKYRFCIQLYRHVASAVNLRGKDVLEVGCGRGGGSSYIMSHLEPKSMTGVDFSEKAIDFCHRYYSMEGLSFFHGDAETLPFEDNTFCVVVNVESSHCYGYMERFLREVYRVLRPNGHFLFADFRSREELFSLREQLNGSGLRLLREEVITPNVLKALELNHENKLAMIQRKAPRLLRKSLESFTGAKGSRIYEGLRSGEIEYLNYVLQRNNHQ